MPKKELPPAPKIDSPTPPVAPPPVPAPPVAPASSSTDVLGIVSIILGVLFLNLPGLIIGLIGASKAKQSGSSPVLSRVGWIINLTGMVITTIVVTLVVILAIIGADSPTHSSDNGPRDNNHSMRLVPTEHFTIDVPNSLSDISDTYPDADAAYGDTSRQEFVLVYYQSKADFAGVTNAASYADKAYESFQNDTSFSDQTRTVLPTDTISNPHHYDVADYRMEAVQDGIRYIYYDRYISTTDGFYMISTWTTPSHEEHNKSSMLSILESFRATGV